MSARGLVCVTAALALCACTGACPVGLRKMQVSTLYFGRLMADGTTVSDDAWAGFRRAALAPALPSGFTETDGTGQWTDPGTHVTVREPTKIVVVASPAGAADTEAALAQVADAYRARFHQQSVGRTRVSGCGAF